MLDTVGIVDESLEHMFWIYSGFTCMETVTCTEHGGFYSKQKIICCFHVQKHVVFTVSKNYFTI